jgi:hypothetical protein
MFMMMTLCLFWATVGAKAVLNVTGKETNLQSILSKDGTSHKV